MAVLLGLCMAVPAQEKPPEKPARENPAKTNPAAERPPQKPDEAPPTPLRILWVGDIVMEVAWRQPAVPPRLLFDGVREKLREYDLVIANLESPLTNWPEPTPHKDKAAIESGRDVIIQVRSPNAARALHDAGIQVVGLANNHTMDYTEHGLLDTFARLRAAHVLFAGAGNNIAAAEAPLILKRKGRRIGILSFSDVVPKYSWAEPDRPGIATAKETVPVIEAVRRARPRVDILILGAHPHVLQGVGCLDRVPVVYSAGNFAFPTSSLPTRRTALFEFDFSAGAAPVVQTSPIVRLVPLLIDERGAPQLAPDDVRADILAEMTQLSSPLDLHLDGDSGSCAASPAPPPPAVPPSSSPP